MKKSLKLNSKQGFTFVEIVVTVALLAIVASLAVVGVSSLSEMYNETTFETLLRKSSASAERIISDQTTYATGIDLIKLSPVENLDDMKSQIAGMSDISENDTVMFIHSADDYTYFQVCNVVPIPTYDANGRIYMSNSLVELKKIKYVGNIDFSVSSYVYSSRCEMSYEVKSFYQDGDNIYNYSLVGSFPLANISFSSDDEASGIIDAEPLEFSLGNIFEEDIPQILVVHHNNS